MCSLAKCFTPCESDEDCEPEGSCPSCSGGFASGKKCLSKPRL